MHERKQVSATDLARRYSDACTRTAIAALTAAAVCWSIGIRLSAIRPLEAYGSFILGREILDEALTDWIASPYKSAIADLLHKNSNPDSITVGELHTVECVDSNTGQTAELEMGSRQNGAPDQKSEPNLTSEVAPSIASRHSIASQAPRPVVVPMAPTGLRVKSYIPCPGVDDIDEAFRHLSEGASDTLAQSPSTKVQIEIWRWQRLLYRVSERARISTESVNMVAGPEYYQYSIRALMELNTSPRTTIAQFSEAVDEQLSIAVPYAPGLQRANSAAVMAELSTAILVAYFALHVWTARRDRLLRAPGTMFFTLLGTFYGRVFLFVGIALPAAAAIFLAIKMQDAEQFVGIGSALLTALMSINLWSTFYRAYNLKTSI